MLGLDLVLRHASLLTIDERSQAHTVTGLVIDIELLDENSGDIGFSQFIPLHQCFFAVLVTANLQYPAIPTNLGRFSFGWLAGALAASGSAFFSAEVSLVAAAGSTCSALLTSSTKRCSSSGMASASALSSIILVSNSGLASTTGGGGITTSNLSLRTPEPSRIIGRKTTASAKITIIPTRRFLMF